MHDMNHSHVWHDSMCCSVLQHVAAGYNMLQGVSVCCRVLQCVAVCCSVLPCAAVRCSMLPCVAVCCSVLQCVAVCCCSVLRWYDTPLEISSVAVCCSALQCVAVCCILLRPNNTFFRSLVAMWSAQECVNRTLDTTLQQSATRCNTLQHAETHCNTLQQKWFLMRKSHSWYHELSWMRIFSIVAVLKIFDRDCTDFTGTHNLVYLNYEYKLSQALYYW